MAINQITTPPVITKAGVQLAVMRNNQNLSLTITHASFGTSKYNPTGNETALKTQKLRVGISSSTKINNKTIQMRIIVQAPQGQGFWCNEIGFWDNNTLFAVYSAANISGDGLIYISDKVETTISFSLALDAMPVDKITVQIMQDADKLAQMMSLHENETNPHPQYASLASPNFTGAPTAPTAPQDTANAQIATTAFVKTAIAALVGSAPAALDTLEELARALAGDANLKQTLLNEIGKKADATAFTALHDLFVGVPIPYPLATVPTGCLAMNGQRFDKNRYPKLGQKYPSGVLPDLRGEFIRGWDNGRGVDAGRGLLSAQMDALQDHVHFIPTVGGDEFEWESNISVFVWDNSSNKVTEGAFVHKNAMPAGKQGNNPNLIDNGEVRTYHASKVQTMYSNIYKQRVANETRPRNIAFQYICLAA